MEPLLAQLRDLPRRFQALSGKLRAAVLGGVVVVLLLAGLGAGLAGRTERYSYAFTNLSTEDSTEAAATLKNADLPFRLEAGGSALAVPADKVYDARLLLAAVGLPRGGGVGFELFDRGDLGVSEFTQKVNLRRAIEGELARTIGHLTNVRSARIHLTLAEHGLYRDDEQKASAAVVLNLQPGRSLSERELAGLRHLVSSSVPDLAVDAVTVVDQTGAALADDTALGSGNSAQRDVEKRIEVRLLSLLEPVVGAGAVVAKVSATVDDAEVTSAAEVFDPDSATLRSERGVSQAQSQDSASASGGVAGAAANQPVLGTGTAPGAAPTSRGSSNTSDQTRNYEISKTTTHTTTRGPRLTRLSVAVLVDGVDGKPRSDAEVARLGELARRAVGFDAARGDQFQITSEVFGRMEEAPPAATPGTAAAPTMIGIGAGVLAIVAVLALALRRRARKDSPALLSTGQTVAKLEAALAAPALLAASPHDALVSQARELAGADPLRAARLLSAWIAADPQPAEVSHA